MKAAAQTKEDFEPIGPRWYIARANHNQERLARASLLSERLDVYLPMTFKTNRKGEIYALPLFPSFLFVRLGMEATGWTRVFSARGVSAVLGTGGRPSAVPDRAVEWIRAQELDHFREHSLHPQECPAFKPGELVAIQKGMFAEFRGVFLERVDAKRSAVMVELFRSARRVEAETAHLEAVS